MHRIFLLGPQGCGKGTQAEILSKRLKIPALSMGQLLREAASGSNDLAEKIKVIQARGDLVSGAMVVEVLRQRLARTDVINGYILDGFPRNQDQYDYYASYDVPTAVIVIEVSREESIKRIINRARSEYRADDTLKIINHRLDLYYQVTNPIIEHYKKQGLVREVDGVGTIEEVSDRIYGVCVKQGGC